jgi:UDP-glucuronate decarboxylase
MRELAELVVTQTNSSSPLITKALPQDDPKQRRPDISIAQAQLGWVPRTSLQSGLTPTIQFFRSRVDN